MFSNSSGRDKFGEPCWGTALVGLGRAWNCQSLDLGLCRSHNVHKTSGHFYPTPQPGRSLIDAQSLMISLLFGSSAEQNDATRKIHLFRATPPNVSLWTCPRRRRSRLAKIPIASTLEIAVGGRNSGCSHPPTQVQYNLVGVGWLGGGNCGKLTRSH